MWPNVLVLPMLLVYFSILFFLFFLASSPACPSTVPSSVRSFSSCATLFKHSTRKIGCAKNRKQILKRYENIESIDSIVRALVLFNTALDAALVDWLNHDAYNALNEIIIDSTNGTRPSTTSLLCLFSHCPPVIFWVCRPGSSFALCPYKTQFHWFRKAVIGVVYSRLLNWLPVVLPAVQLEKIEMA